MWDGGRVRCRKVRRKDDKGEVGEEDQLLYVGIEVMKN